MGEQAARMTAAGAAMRIAGALVASVLLLQLMLATPLAMRMLAGVVQDGWAVRLCTGGSARPDDAPKHAPHRHDACLLCQSHAAPLGPVAVAALVPAVAVPWHLASAPARVIPMRAAPSGPYQPRAPPAFG